MIGMAISRRGPYGGYRIARLKLCIVCKDEGIEEAACTATLCKKHAYEERKNKANAKKIQK